MHLSQLGTSLRILSRAESGSCMFSPLTAAISTSSLLWDLHHARCCSAQTSDLSGSVILYHGSAPSQRQELLQLFDLDQLDIPCVCSGDWGNFWQVTYCRKMREWKWLFMNGFKYGSLIYGTVEFLRYCKGVVDASNFLGIMLKIMIL